MKLELSFPREGGGARNVKLDPEARSVTLEPEYYDGQLVQPIAFITMATGQNRNQRYVLLADGRGDGKMVLKSAVPITAPCDKRPGAKPVGVPS